MAVLCGDRRLGNVAGAVFRQAVVGEGLEEFPGYVVERKDVQNKILYMRRVKS